MNDNNRLIYETEAGSLSARATFEQLSEYLQLAIEDANRLATFRALRNDNSVSLQWTVIAKKFTQVQDAIKALSASPARPSAIGYTGRGPSTN